MSESIAKSTSPVPSSSSNALAEAPVTYRILRSPSHESVTTDLSLFSVSSIASDARGNRLVTFKSYSDVQLSCRVPSPNPDSRQSHKRPADIPEVLWFEEETELIRSCGLLSSALGLQKSFSTSDISQLPHPDVNGYAGLRPAVSVMALDSAFRTGLLLEQARIDHASRSCSTWVAVDVGDVANTSQLPSPHGGSSLPPPVLSATASQLPPAPPFTAADLVKSVNKKVRQNYIRRRLLTTYRALERLSQSEFNLDRLEAAASAAQSCAGATLMVPGSAPVNTSILSKKKNHPLTIRDVERERNSQLSKYERNMMIFNWLHTLEDTAVDSIQ